MTKNYENRTVATNRKARHDYFLEDTIEAGIALRGSEIKSLRAGQVSIRQSYVKVDGQEAWLIDSHIATYNPASHMNHDPLRPRQLLLHKRQIANLFNKMRSKGYTIVPTRIYLKDGRAKVEIALARGKRDYDKRQAIAKRDADREARRQMGRKE